MRASPPPPEVPTERSVDNHHEDALNFPKNHTKFPGKGSTSSSFLQEGVAQRVADGSTESRSGERREDALGDSSPRSPDEGARFPLQPGSDARSNERQEMEHRILIAAASLFHRRGFGGATTRELAKSLGLQRASLYHYLDSKQDLLYALCVASLQIISREVEEAAKAASPEERLRCAIRAHVEAAVRDQDMHAVMLAELRSLEPERQAEVKSLRAAYEQQIRQLLCEEQDAGKLRSDIECKYLTLMLLNLLNWTIFWYKSSGPLQARELGDLLADLFLEGARPRPPDSSRATRRARPIRNSSRSEAESALPSGISLTTAKFSSQQT